MLTIGVQIALPSSWQILEDWWVIGKCGRGKWAGMERLGGAGKEWSSPSPFCFSTWLPGEGEYLGWLLAALLKHIQSFVLIKLAVLNLCVGSEPSRNSISMRHQSKVVRTGSGLPGTQAWPQTSFPNFILFVFFPKCFPPTPCLLMLFFFSF